MSILATLGGYCSSALSTAIGTTVSYIGSFLGFIPTTLRVAYGLILYVVSWLTVFIRSLCSLLWPIYLILVSCGEVAAYSCPQCTNRIRSTLKTAKKKFYNLTRKPFIGWAFKAVACVIQMLIRIMMGLRQLSELYKAFLFWILLNILLYVIGSPLLWLSAFPQHAAEILAQSFTGFKGGFNIVAKLYNTVVEIFDILNPFLLVGMGGAYQIILLTVGYIASEAGYNINSPIDRRSLADNPFFVSNPEYYNQERDIQAASLGIASILARVVDFVIILYDLVLSFIIPLISLLIQVFTGQAKLATCCTINADAFFCCLNSTFTKLIILIVKLFGIPITVPETLFAGPCQAPKDVPCNCAAKEGGVILGMNGCTIARYSCIFEPGDPGLWIQRQIFDDSREPLVVASSSISRDAGCPNQDSFRSNRRLLDNSELKCSFHCQRWENKGWLFKDCNNGERYYQGDCTDEDRFLTGTEAKKHIEQYAHAFQISKEEKHSLLYKKEPPTTTPPTREQISKEQFFKLIHQKEQVEDKTIDLDCSVDLSNKSFENYLLRATCLFLKWSHNGGSLLIQNGYDAWSGGIGYHDHLRVLISYQNGTLDFQSFQKELINTHQEWFYNRYNKKRELYSTSKTFIPMLSNYTANMATKYYKGMDMYNEMVATTRKLVNSKDLGVFTSEGPFCPYLCPDNTCVTLERIESCKVPTEWDAGVVVRYFFHILAVGAVNIDLRYLLQSTVSCWAQYETNPGIDPTTYDYVEKIATGKNTDNYLFCFPLIRRLPYAPEVSWDLYKFIQNTCGQSFTLTGGAIQLCNCPQYAQLGSVLDFNAVWMTLSNQFMGSCIYNTWKPIQYYLTRWGWFTNFVGGLWYGFWSLVTPWASEEWLLALNAQNADAGMTYTDNVRCMVLNTGSYLVAITYFFYPLIILLYYYYKWTNVSIKDAITPCLQWIMNGLNWLTLKHRTYVTDTAEYRQIRYDMEMGMRNLGIPTNINSHNNNKINNV